MEENANPQPEQQDDKQSSKRTSPVPRLEILIIIVFFGSFFIWAANRCTATRERYREIERQAQMDDSIYNSEITFEPANATPIPQPDTETNAPTPQQQQTQSTITREKFTPLYVTIPNLNLRDRPNIGGRLLTSLKLFDEVEFLNEVTDFKQEINLGDTITIAPWIKVKSKTGHTGWVYGAGVYYYKIELSPKSE